MRCPIYFGLTTKHPAFQCLCRFSHMKLDTVPSMFSFSLIYLISPSFYVATEKVKQLFTFAFLLSLPFFFLKILRASISFCLQRLFPDYILIFFLLYLTVKLCSEHQDLLLEKEAFVIENLFPLPHQCLDSSVLDNKPRSKPKRLS